jgi:hypothetical protein
LANHAAELNINGLAAVWLLAQEPSGIWVKGVDYSCGSATQCDVTLCWHNTLETDLLVPLQTFLWEGGVVQREGRSELQQGSRLKAAPASQLQQLQLGPLPGTAPQPPPEPR